MSSLMDYYNRMDELTNEQLGELIVKLSSEITPRSMFTKPALELARRFAPQAKQPDVQYAVGNASQGLAAGRNTKAMKAVEENHNGQSS